MPEETLSQVEAKRQALATLTTSDERSRLKLAADAWIVAFIARKRPGALVPTTRTVWESAGGGVVPASLVNEIEHLILRAFD